jgi:hypothetical protein
MEYSTGTNTLFSERTESLVDGRACEWTSPCGIGQITDYSAKIFLVILVPGVSKS